MHFGLITNPASNAGKLYKILSAEPGKLFDAWDLAMMIKTTCIGTVVSEVRQQLPLGQTLDHVSPARKLHFYRLNVGQGELVLWAPLRKGI